MLPSALRSGRSVITICTLYLPRSAWMPVKSLLTLLMAYWITLPSTMLLLLPAVLARVFCTPATLAEKSITAFFLPSADTPYTVAAAPVPTTTASPAVVLVTATLSM